MTYDIAVVFDNNDELIQALVWIDSLGIKHIVDWRWFMHFDSIVDCFRCTFQFDRAEYAEWFALRWV